MNIKEFKLLSIKDALNNFYFAFYGVLLGGTFVLGIIRSILLDIFRSYGMFVPFSIVAAIVTISYIVFSILIVFKTSNSLSLFYNKLICLFLGFYISACGISFVLIGSFSPLTFTGIISYQIAIGTNVLTLFYPLIK